MLLSRRLFRYWFLGSLVWILFWGRQQDILCLERPGQTQTTWACGEKAYEGARDWHEISQLVFGGPVIAGAIIFLAYWTFKYFRKPR